MARGINQQLTGGRELPYISHRDAYAGSLFQRIIRAVNTLAQNASVSAVGKLSPPPPVNSIQVQGTQSGNVITCPTEHLHFTLTHNGELKKGVQYISEISANDPNFLQPHILDHGCSRSGFIHLPALQADNVTPNIYYLRSYAQYHGSDPNKPTVLGGLTGATGIQLTPPAGVTPAGMNLLPSTGSGTAAANGQQGSKGLGTVLLRPAPGPKRNLV